VLTLHKANAVPVGSRQLQTHKGLRLTGGPCAGVMVPGGMRRPNPLELPTGISQ